jgi:hypothetical protein
MYWQGYESCRRPAEIGSHYMRHAPHARAYFTIHSSWMHYYPFMEQIQPIKTRKPVEVKVSVVYGTCRAIEASKS